MHRQELSRRRRPRAGGFAVKACLLIIVTGQTCNACNAASGRWHPWPHCTVSTKQKLKSRTNFAATCVETALRGSIHVGGAIAGHCDRHYQTLPTARHHGSSSRFRVPLLYSRCQRRRLQRHGAEAGLCSSRKRVLCMDGAEEKRRARDAEGLFDTVHGDGAAQGGYADEDVAGPAAGGRPEGRRGA